MLINGILCNVYMFFIMFVVAKAFKYKSKNSIKLNLAQELAVGLFFICIPFFGALVFFGSVIYILCEYKKQTEKDYK